MLTEPGRLIAGRYRLLSVLGNGGMGTVWRSHDDVLDRLVAVKEITPPADVTSDEGQTLRERTLREARIAARLSHPNVVTIYDVVEDGDKPWIVMELVEARTLRDVVEETGPLPPPRVAAVGLQLLAALRAAHELGIVHRDVKPGNVLIDAGGRAVLADFGIARGVDSPSLTSSGVLVGSPSYTAPERARGERGGPESDLWSLGATLYTAVEGRLPYERNGAWATLTAVVTQEPDPPQLAGPLWPVLSELLRRDPDRRLRPRAAEQMLRQVAETPDPEGTLPLGEPDVGAPGAGAAGIAGAAGVTGGARAPGAAGVTGGAGAPGAAGVTRGAGATGVAGVAGVVGAVGAAGAAEVAGGAVAGAAAGAAAAAGSAAVSGLAQAEETRAFHRQPGVTGPAPGAGAPGVPAQAGAEPGAPARTGPAPGLLPGSRPGPAAYRPAEPRPAPRPARSPGNRSGRRSFWLGAVAAAAVVLIGGVALALNLAGGAGSAPGSGRHSGTGHTRHAHGSSPAPGGKRTAPASPGKSRGHSPHGQPGPGSRGHTPPGQQGSGPGPGGSSALPAGYHRYRDATGFSIGVPAGGPSPTRDITSTSRRLPEGCSCS